MKARNATVVLLYTALALTGCALTPPASPGGGTPASVYNNRSPAPTFSPSNPRIPSPASSTVSPLPTQAPSPSPLPTSDPLEAMVTRMSVKEKVGQLFMVYSTQAVFDAELESAIVEDHVGGIILFPPNVENPAQVAELINQAQAAATSTDMAIPLLVAVDQEGGLIMRLRDGFTQFPSQMAVGATQKPEDARLVARTIAHELHTVGINMNLAPVLDVNSNPLNPVIGTRSFGGSPDLVAQMGLAAIEAYRQQGIVSTAKHFPGHGDTDIDSHYGLPTVPHDLERLWAVELAPFQAAADAGVDVIMTAHVSFPAVDATPGLPATLSPLVLQDLLRSHMGFDGLIATDSLGMGALSNMYDESEAAALALQAGADLLMFGNDPGHTPAEAREAYAHVLDLVRSGVIPLDQVEASLRRVLALKERYGLLAWQPIDQQAAPLLCGTVESRAAALDVALDSVTLLNNDGVLPFSADTSVLLVVPDNVIGLDSSLKVYLPALDAVVISLNPTPEQIATVAARAKTADVVVVATWDVAWHDGQVSLLQALAGQPLVVTALNTPYDLIPLQAAGFDPSAYVCTYTDVPPSLEALAMVLSGVELPRGRLPVAVGDAYPIGYGWESYDEP